MAGQTGKFNEALKTDLEELLGRFQRTSSVRYEDFSSIWRDMKFDTIFHGMTIVKEKNEFSRMILNAATGYLLPPYAFQVRVGGLYILYGLYHSQNSFPKQKIRLALKDMNDIQAFTQDAQSSRHYDVVYIMHKLLGAKAFHFTGMPVPLTYLREKKQRAPTTVTNIEAPDQPTASRLQQLVTPQLLEEVANIHQHYKELKASVTAQHPEASLNVVRQNLVPKLFNSVMSFNTWQNIHMTKEDDRDEQPSSLNLEEPSTSSSFNQQQESSRRAGLLASIKARSYGQVVEMAKSRRHRQVELCSAAESGPQENIRIGLEPEGKPVVAVKRRRLRFNNSLRFRTLRHLYESGGIPEEFLKSTKLWKLSKSENDDTTERVVRRFSW